MPPIKKMYDKADELNEEEVTDMEAKSHMSFLTNKRLHELYVLRDEYGVQAGFSFQINELMMFASVLYRIYAYWSTVISDSQNDILEDAFTKYQNEIFRKDLTPQKRWELYLLLAKVDRLLSAYAQQFNYLFRFEEKIATGIEATIKKRGWDKIEGIGFVSGRPVPGVDEK